MDEIRQKLARIDDQLAGRTLWRRMVSTAPLFLPAVGLIVGILIQYGLSDGPTTPAPRVLPWIWLAGIVSAGAVMLVGRVRVRLGPQGCVVLTSCCFLCLGAIRLLSFHTAGPSDIRHCVGSERALATVRGRILTEPYQQREDWLFSQFASTDPTTTFYLRMEAIQTPKGWRVMEGTVRVRVDEPAPNLQIGDRIEAYCWLHRYDEPTNPGQFNVARYLRLKNVHVGISVPSREAVTVVEGLSPSVLAGLRTTLTDAATRALLDHPPSDTPGEAMLQALLLGERRGIDPDTYEAFRRTGLLHIVSLSGMHLCILIGIVWWVGKPLGLGKSIRAVTCIVATTVFLFIVPPQAPILRASVIVWSFCTSILLRRRANPLNSLSLAVIILLLIQPTQLFDVGWQLSFAATAGILAFTERIRSGVQERTLARLEPLILEAAAATRVLGALANGIVRAMAVGLAAWLASAGILLYHFYNITPLASVWTVIAALPVTAILTVGFLKIVLAFFLPTLSMLLGYALSLLADLLIGVVRLMAQIDPSYLLIGRVPLLLILLYYAMILFAAYVPLRRPRVRTVLCSAMLLTLFVSLGGLKWQRTHREDLSMTCLDVGHGQAILVRFPGTTNILFDAGSLYGRDIGTTIIVPFLDHEGIGRLDAVVVSHADIDHINGLPEVANLCKIGRVCFDDVSFGKSQDAETIQVLRGHLADRRVRIEPMPATMDLGPAQVRVLWPIPEAAARTDLGDNDRSLVCQIEYAGRTALLCSDIEGVAQRQMMALYPALRADVVVAPHHGSTRTLDDRFLKQLTPSVVLCSCGRRDCEQGRVIDASPTGQLRITAVEGAVGVCIDPTGVIQTAAYKQQ
ncbi:MAG TPA: DNA internalization-related competence protein ComEC/Rec2 [Sedimentisphaerales bacterium]|nr:DNA internalization-related competence protein ComEC/Rec2 [Sedimentisphaerales bacterium]HNU29865.1 DNA internalization-related competence protein ComEC/Rec2 [Sedimentisphaerales bacterium]